MTAAGTAELSRVTAEQGGNVTDTHRAVLAELSPRSDGEWSTRALWACLEELRHSVITGADRVRVHDAWTDGADAFCVVYAPPYQPDEHVGVRRHVDDQDPPVSYGMGSALFQQHGSELPDTSGPVDPIAFGVAVAAFDIGEPLGSYYDNLRRDDRGIGWWGSLGVVLPQHGDLP